jgi:hypothetical protein
VGSGPVAWRFGRRFIVRRFIVRRFIVRRFIVRRFVVRRSRFAIERRGEFRRRSIGAAGWRRFARHSPSALERAACG